MNRFKDVWIPKLEDVKRLKGPAYLEEFPDLSYMASKKLWSLLTTKDYVQALGAATGNQAMQMVKAGLRSIYVSGWQTAADANDSLHMYPDQSLYSVNSVPMLVRRINNTLKRAAQIEWTEERDPEPQEKRWIAPIVADGEAGFGGPLNVFELTKALIEAGAGGVHFEDQLSSAKKCGHLGGKVLVPASEFIKKLKAARLAAEVLSVPLVIIARTDANSAKLLTSNHDDTDYKFIKNPKELWQSTRTSEGFYHISGGLEMAINRGLQYAPYADVLWMETGKPDLDEAKQFADAIHEKFPGKLLAYNCSPSFNWKEHLDPVTIGQFQAELGAMGYKFQFITLAGFHSLNYGMFDLAKNYSLMGMTAYTQLQQKEFEDEKEGYTAHKHQREVGTSYFDLVAQTIDGESSVLAMEESTEKEQF